MTAALPAGTRLLHIGPHKTGTTALQSAFHGHRAELAEHGVHYAGKESQPGNAAYAAIRARPFEGGRPYEKSHWLDLLAEIRSSTADRVVVSSEFFADATDAGARRITKALDRERLHVVVTLRPLSRILASQWQQYVQNRLTMSYDEWLEAVLADPPDPAVTPTFWHRHRHDLLVERWASAAGPANVTVVVVDDDDPLALMRTFEDLLELPRSTLLPEVVRANRSLTAAEARLVRAVNMAYDRSHLPPRIYQRVVRAGAARYLLEREPAASARRITTPAWALDRTRARSEQMTAAIKASGVRTIGDLSKLTIAPETRPDGGASGDEPVPFRLVARFLVGTARSLLPRSRANRSGPGSD